MAAGLWEAFVARLNLGLTSLTQATYLGGSGDDVAFALAVTASGVYVAGDAGEDFPGTEGGAQENWGGGFAARFNLDLTELIQSTHGGGGDALVVTESDVYVAGGGNDVRVARLTLDLTSLTQSMYLGGDDRDGASALVVTASAVYVAGFTRSTDFPGTTGGAQESYGGGNTDAFVARIGLDFQAPTLSISDVTRSEGNAGTTAFTFTVTLTGASNLTHTVDWATADAIATEGSDYTAASGTLTFPPSTAATQTQTITVQVTGDTVLERNETFFVNLENPIKVTIVDGQGVGTIRNEDTVPVLWISDVSQTEGNNNEEGRGFTFTVTLSNPVASSVTVDYATTNGSASAGSDYTAIPATLLMFSPGQTSKAVVVQVTDDTTVESDETFMVNLSGVVGATIADGQGIGTIQNDDTAELRINDVSRAEGNRGSSAFNFTMTLSNPSASSVTVSYATVNGSAVAGSDYTALPVTRLTFSPGQTSKTVVVNVTGDTMKEPNETFVVNLGSASAATIFDGRGIGTILNED